MMNSSLKIIYERLVRETLIPLALMMITPHLTVLFPYIIIHKKGQFTSTLRKQPIFSLIQESWNSVNLFDFECWLIIMVTLFWAIITILLLPGKKYYGPPTSNNFRPQYWDNGFKYYLISMAITIPFIWKHSVLHLFYKIPDFMAILVVFGFIFCAFLYIKGMIAPDPGLYNMTKNPIFDYYWGIELYPQMGKYISIKMLIISRFGLWLWQFIVLICWKAHFELYNSHYDKGNVIYPMATSTILQTIYLAKFYYWEDGYMQTIDITDDRFGFYTCWGCIAFVPGYFTLHSLYLVKYSPIIGYSAFINFLILLFGLFSIFGNYWVDYQRQLVRKTDGQCLIWFQKPLLIRAKYKDDNGVERNSVLLASGFWSVARHFNYTLETMIALSFGLPALNTSIVPYLYVIFLSVLLFHRTFRDDAKCSKKYGRYWQEYCKMVPYKLFPYIF